MAKSLHLKSTKLIQQLIELLSRQLIREIVVAFCCNFFFLFVFYVQFCSVCSIYTIFFYSLSALKFKWNHLSNVKIYVVEFFLLKNMHCFVKKALYWAGLRGRDRRDFVRLKTLLMVGFYDYVLKTLPV